MHQHEWRGVVAGTLDARRAVRLIAQHEIEWRRAVVLRGFNEAERVVGAKDHHHRLRRRVPQRPGNGRRVGRDRDLQFLQRGVLIVPSGARIGADPDIAVQDRSLFRPFPHRLLEQRY